LEILLNGAPREVPDDVDVAALVVLLELGGRRLAIEVNREIVPRGAQDGFCLHPGDRVEIVHAIGGGIDQVRNS
jgi:thiamine biosynthesis protein ThiS